MLSRPISSFFSFSPAVVACLPAQHPVLTLLFSCMVQELVVKAQEKRLAADEYSTGTDHSLITCSCRQLPSK